MGDLHLPCSSPFLCSTDVAPSKADSVPELLNYLTPASRSEEVGAGSKVRGRVRVRVRGRRDVFPQANPPCIDTQHTTND